MPVKKALAALESSGRFVRDAGGRIRSESVETPVELVGNRIVSATSTIALGGSIAAVVTYYLQPPEALHAHVVALVIFAWQSLVFGVGWWMSRRS